MPKSNFKGVVTTCAVSLFAVSSANAQTMGGLVLGGIEGMATPSFAIFSGPGSKPTTGVRASDAEVEEWVKLKLPNFARVDMVKLSRDQGIAKLGNPVSVTLSIPGINISDQRRENFTEVIDPDREERRLAFNDGFAEILEPGQKTAFETPKEKTFNRNMVKKDLDNACKSNGSAQNCTETFEAAANVVAVLDPNKNSAAIWTGQTAKKVSDDLVKLDGTQEQVKNVINTSVNVIGFMENQLQPNVSIAGGKESAALNLVKTSLNLMKTKPAIKQEADEIEPPIIDALKQVRSLGSPAINRVVIGPVIQKFDAQAALAKNNNNTSGPVASTGSAIGGVTTKSIARTAGIIASTSIAVQAATRGWEERKASEARKHSDQRDAANTALTALQTTTQPQVVLQQQQQQQQPQAQGQPQAQINCNGQWQDC